MHNVEPMIFDTKMSKYGIFAAKTCKYALIDSFEGYAVVIDSSTNCAALVMMVMIMMMMINFILKDLLCVNFHRFAILT